MRRIRSHPGKSQGEQRKKKNMKTIEEVLCFEIKEIKKQIKTLNDGEKIYSEIAKLCLGVAQASISNANTIEDLEEKSNFLVQGMQAVLDVIAKTKSEHTTSSVCLKAKLEVLSKLLKEDRLYREEKEDEDLD